MTVCLEIKILGYRTPQRYSLRRTVQAALPELERRHPGLQAHIHEVRELEQILRYTAVLVLPALVINEQLVCAGRFPRKEEVAAWLQSAVEALEKL